MLVFLVSSAVVATIYYIAMLATLVAVRCRVHISAIVIMGTFLYSFSIKVLSDVLKVAETSVFKEIYYFNYASDKISLLAMLYLGFIVKEVEIRLRANSREELDLQLAIFTRKRRIVFLVLVVLILSDFTLFLIFLGKSDEPLPAYVT
jgi:hypothetical protein